MIYAGTDEDGNDWIIHSEGTFDDQLYLKMEKLSESHYADAVFKTVNPTSEVRRKVVSFAYSKIGLPYPFNEHVTVELLKCLSPFSSCNYVPPSVEQQKGYVRYNLPGYGETETYTCVGLVERAYEEAGMDITPNGHGRNVFESDSTWTEAEGSYVCFGVQFDSVYVCSNVYGWVFFPYTQWYRQTHRDHRLNSERVSDPVDEPPSVEITSPSQNGVFPEDHKIKATATDGPRGSGIFKVEFYLDGTDQSDMIGKVYTYTEGGRPVFYYKHENVPIELDEYVYEVDASSISPGRHKLYAISYDRAGHASSPDEVDFWICSNECESNQTLCNGHYLQKCGNYDSDPCLEWPESIEDSDDCSDCSCSCGDYNQDESDFCDDGKDNDCDGDIDMDDSDCGVKFIRGDANMDGMTNIADAIYTLSYLFAGKPASCLDALDSNDDGQVNIADAIYLLQYLFANGPEPPKPFPEAGTDPTPDDLSCTGLETQNPLKSLPSEGIKATESSDADKTVKETIIKTLEDLLPQGDVNRDCRVDIFDLAEVGMNYGKSSDEATNSRADINKDEEINIFDLAIVGKNYGRNC